MDKRKFIRRGMPILASIILLSATTVAVAGDRLVTSQGRYEINDGKGSVVIDSDDIENNAQAIAALQGQLGGLNFKFATEKEVNGSGDDSKGYYWSQDSNGDWVKIGAVGSAVPTDVLSGKKFSSEYGVDVEGEMPVPTSAEIASRANPSSNLSVNGQKVNIMNNGATTEDHKKDATQIDIGVGQQITIPHGYYNKDIVIKNGVSNKGALNWNPSSSTSKSVQAGYYTSGTLNSSGAYNAGINAVKNNPKSYGLRSSTIPTPFCWTPAFEGQNSSDAGAETTYIVPETGEYRLFGSIAAHVDDTHRTNIKASVSVNGREILNAYNSVYGERNDGQTIWASASETVNLTAGQALVLKVHADGFGTVRWQDGAMIVIAYSGK